MASDLGHAHEPLPQNGLEGSRIVFGGVREHMNPWVEVSGFVSRVSGSDHAQEALREVNCEVTHSERNKPFAWCKSGFAICISGFAVCLDLHIKIQCLSESHFECT